MSTLLTEFCHFFNVPTLAPTCVGSSSLLKYGQYVAELFIGLYLADLIGGIVHMSLDYSEVKNDNLRLHAENTIPAVTQFKETSKIFKEASDRDQFLWNFHIHHEATYPASDSEWELYMQIFRPLSGPLVVSIAAAYFGYMPMWIARPWIFALIVGSCMQKIHFLAHARNHKCLDSSVIKFLQDYKLLLHPDDHRKHHEEFDCNFCIFNGWANPVVNTIRKILTAVSIFPSEPPTARARRERRERAEKAACK